MVLGRWAATESQHQTQGPLFSICLKLTLHLPFPRSPGFLRGLKTETEGQMWPDVPTISWLEAISLVPVVLWSKEVVDER